MPGLTSIDAEVVAVEVFVVEMVVVELVEFGAAVVEDSARTLAGTVEVVGESVVEIAGRGSG